MRVAASMLLCWLTPAWAGAQTAPPALPTNDTAIAIGWTGSEFRPERYNNWRSGLLVGVSGGHYWTDHLKTEFGAGWNTPGTDEVYEDLVIEGGPTYATANHRAHDVRLGVTQIYQFGRNAWVNPFVGVGIDVVRRDTRIDRPQQTRTVYVPPNRNIPVVIPAASERRTDVFGQAVLKTGLKMYATEKAFFTTAFKIGFREDVDYVVWNVGFGVDF